MGVFFRKKRGVALTAIAKLSIIAAIVGLSFSFVETIWAVYIDSFVHSVVWVGFISAFLTLISFLSFFFIIPLIEKYSKSRLFAYSLLLFAVSYFLFSLINNFYVFIILAVFVFILLSLRIICFGIIVRDKSSERQLSRNEGMTYTSLNLAWLIGPLIAGYFSTVYGIKSVFILASMFVFLAFVFFRFSNIKDVNIEKKIHKKVVRNFLDFFKNKDRVYAYILGGGVNLWWVLIYLFMPLYIIREGLGIRWVGYFLFAVAIPLVLLEYPFSKFAGKIGFKKIFKIGFFIPFFLSFLCFLIGDVYLIMFFLILSSIGLAMLGATTEAYFFDTLRGKQELRFYGPYNTAIDANHFLGKMSSSLLLLILPFNYIFLLYSFFMLVMFLLSFKVRNIVERRRDGRLN